MCGGRDESRGNGPNTPTQACPRVGDDLAASNSGESNPGQLGSQGGASQLASLSVAYDAFCRSLHVTTKDTDAEPWASSGWPLHARHPGQGRIDPGGSKALHGVGSFTRAAGSSIFAPGDSSAVPAFPSLRLTTSASPGEGAAHQGGSHLLSIVLIINDWHHLWNGRRMSALLGGGMFRRQGGQASKCMPPDECPIPCRSYGA